MGRLWPDLQKPFGRSLAESTEARRLVTGRQHQAMECEFGGVGRQWASPMTQPADGLNSPLPVGRLTIRTMDRQYVDP
jgi:hypothetical protein